MDTFQQNQLPGVELDSFTFYPFSCFKVIMRNLDFFTGNQFLYMLVQQFPVQRIQCFVIVITIFSARSGFTVDKVVIHLECVRSQSLR